ncbi:hypothetical protein [Sphingomonas alba]|uniref:DUF86 domain-containing protein n=1 Tax=Sphingomonas alba TaxID=2908208 RepID=A0ABT0RQL8_9SPHN|nr:hypothetical protein [Sphingomonas alba]MCL6684780.1 hypothetical protein [Sphingomonas alba]
MPRKVGEAESIINDLRQLRQVIIHAWNERSVMLTKEERRELQSEVRETCDLLNELTSDP